MSLNNCVTAVADLSLSLRSACSPLVVLFRDNPLSIDSAISLLEIREKPYFVMFYS